MDLSVNVTFSTDPRIFEIRGEDDFMMGFDDMVDLFHNLIEAFGSFFFKSKQAIVEARLHVKTVPLLVFIGVDEMI